MKKVPWTASEDTTLVAMHGDGCSYKEIGVALGRTAAAVETHAYLLRTRGVAGLTSHKHKSSWTHENIAEACRLADEGLTNVQVARRIGAASFYVGKMLAHVGDDPVAGAPDEPVSVSKPYVDPRVVVRELEQAKAALRRAERRYAETMEPIHAVVRSAIEDAKLPWFDMAIPDRDIAEDLCTALRKQGYVVVQAGRAGSRSASTSHAPPTNAQPGRAS